jgi:hypothetical protein
MMVVAGVGHTDDPTGPLGRSVAVKFQKDIRTGTLAECEAVQNRQMGAVSQRAQFVQQVLRRSVEADIYQRLSTGLGGQDKIQRKCGGETAGVIIPHDIVPNLEPAEQPVQIVDSGRHRYGVSFHGHLTPQWIDKPAKGILTASTVEDIHISVNRCILLSLILDENNNPADDMG